MKPYKNITYQKLRDAVNAVQKVYLNSSEHLPIKELCQINNLTLHFKELEKEQTKPQINRKKEIMKIRTEIY
jgi:hypothetical protein